MYISPTSLSGGYLLANKVVAIKSTLAEMTELNGRETEKDFFGNKDGYKTIMSKNSVGSPCIRCGTIIKKENYYGGSIYYCEKCQTMEE